MEEKSTSKYSRINADNTFTEAVEIARKGKKDVFYYEDIPYRVDHAEWILKYCEGKENLV